MVLHDHLYSKPTLESQILETKKKIEELEKEIQLLRLEKFGLERFSSDCELIRFYTGFRSYECLKAIFIWLERTSQTLVTWSQVQHSGVSPVDFKKVRINSTDKRFETSLAMIDQFFSFSN